MQKKLVALNVTTYENKNSKEKLLPVLRKLSGFQEKRLQAKFKIL